MTTVDLYVDSYGSERTGWTRTGTSPYLNAQDQPTNLVSVNNKNLEVGDFGLADLSGSPAINSVILYFYCNCGTENIDVYVWDGSQWSSAYPFTGNGYSWRTSDVSSFLSTVEKVNNAKVYLKSRATGGWSGTVYGDCIYLRVDYTLGPTPITVTDSFGLSEQLSRGKDIKVSDSFGQSESIRGNKGLVLTDALGLIEVVLKSRGLQLQDNIGLTDTQIRGRVITILDNLGFSETLLRNRAISLLDALGLSEARLISKGLLVQENLGLSVSPIAGKVLKILDQFGLTEAYRIGKNILISEGFGITELKLINKDIKLLEALGVGEQLKGEKGVLVVDYLGLDEEVLVVGGGIAVPKLVQDQIGLTDAVVVHKFYLLIPLSSLALLKVSQNVVQDKIHTSLEAIRRASIVTVLRRSMRITVETRPIKLEVVS